MARCDHPVEIDEERIGVVRAGGSFRVVLDAENGELRVAEALDGVVVEIDLGDLGAGFSSDCGSVAKPWFCAVMETLPVSRFFTG